MNRQLAIVKSAGFCTERGILTFDIYVDYENGYSQMVGDLVLDEYCKKSESRTGTAYGCEMIIRLFKLFEVTCLSDAKDTIVWVYGEGDGLSFKPMGIGRLKVHGGEKLIFADVAQEFIGQAA